MKVLNKKKDRIPSGAFYVGRPGPLGNPYVIGRDGTREDVVLQYEIWFSEQLKDPEFKALVEDLRKYKALICWCAPEACHADVIARYLEKTK